jgi:hypothetical protein
MTRSTTRIFPQSGRAVENPGQHPAHTAGHVHDVLEVGEIVDCQDRRRVSGGQVRHAAVEAGGLLRMRSQILEQLGSERVLGSRVAVRDGGADGLNGVELPGVEQRRRGMAQARLRVCPQDIGARRLRKRPVLAFVKDAHTRQRSQQPVQRVLVHVRQGGQFGGRLRSRFQMIGYAEICGGTDTHRVPRGEDHFEDGHVRSCGRSVGNSCHGEERTP